MSGTPSPRYVVGSGIVWLAAAVVIFSIGLALVLREPPRVIKEAAPPDWFSAERAMVHVEAIAKVPHPWGSPAQEPVREYIREVLLRYDIVAEDQVTPAPGDEEDGRDVHNILGRLPGAEPTKAVLLMAHYDSRREGPGAADDASGVATLLETLRALKIGPQLKNDVIFLFTDAEEACLCGAKAFVDFHPWAQDVGVVMNFDGRGAGGPVYLSDAGDQNGWLIEQVDAAAPFPRGNSLMRDVQRYMPNDSDLTPFRNAGYSVLNFNFMDDYARYHKATDIPAAVSRGTVQHLGEYALPLTKHFGNIDLSDTKAPNAAYFNLIGNVFFFYPLWWGYIAVAVSVLVYAGVFFVGRRLGHVSIKASLLATVLFLAVGTVICVLSYFIANQFRVLHGNDIYWVLNVYLGFFAAFAVMLMAISVAIGRLWLRAQDLAMGALFVWLVLTVGVTVFMPGGHPLFVWPLFAMLIALGIHFGIDDFEMVGTSGGAAFAIAALPALFIFTPAIIAFNQAMLFQYFYVNIAFVVLVCGLIMPLLCILVSNRPWPLPVTAALIANVFLIWALAAAEPQARWAKEEAEAYLQSMQEQQAAPEETKQDDEVSEDQPIPSETAPEQDAAPVEDEEATPEMLDPEPAEVEPAPAGDPEGEEAMQEPATEPAPGTGAESTTEAVPDVPETIDPSESDSESASDVEAGPDEAMEEDNAPPAEAEETGRTQEEPVPDTVDAPEVIDEAEPETPEAEASAGAPDAGNR